MKPYEYEGPDGELEIWPGGPEVARVRVTDGDCASVTVLKADVPAAALALYEAAGLPAPLVLPRPEHTGGIEHAGRTDRYAHTSRVGSKVAIGWRGIEPAELDPDEALLFAAHIAVNAEAVKAAEPDPDEVEELAEVIRTEMFPDHVRRSYPDLDTVVARIALRWMNARAEADQ